MKKVLIIASVLTLALSICACKNEADNTSIPSTVTPSSTIDTASTASTESEISSDITTSSETDTTSSNDTETTSSDTASQSSKAPMSKPVHVHEFANATCKEPAKCSCGETQGELSDHIFTDGVCIFCNFKSLNSNASHGIYQGVFESDDGVVTKLKVDFYPNTEFIMMMGTKYFLKDPADAHPESIFVDYNDKRYYYNIEYDVIDIQGNNIVVTDTTVEFDSYNLKYHFLFEFTGDSFVIKESTFFEYPVGTELKMTTDWH